MYVVGFNGPPRSGKDTMASMVANRVEHTLDPKSRASFPVLVRPLSTPLRRIAYAATGEFDRDLFGHEYEAFKETEFPDFGYKTGRRLMIDVSESYLKELYGQTILPKIWLNQIRKEVTGRCLILVPDCGFQSEVDFLAKSLGNRNLYIARMYRQGCSFENDSRERVIHRHDGDYINRGGLAELRHSARDLVSLLKDRMGWML